ncbi:glycosyltransferase [Bradyrhizobium sp. McL0615]|uniref:glycosyltransferase n=1 Tax=Bradyrhizobium sp. McL0615 TaxID=3415673 RepID=UPI003CE6BD42
MSTQTVFCVIGSLDVGGAERHLVQVLPRLDRKRWSPVVYCLTERGSLADELEANGVPVLTSALDPPPKGGSRVRRAWWVAATTLKLAATMRSLDPAIAHFFLPAAYILGAPAAFLARIPVRIMSRRSLNEYHTGHRFLRLVERNLHPAMSAILGNSRSVVQELHQKEGIPKDRLGLIYNGIDQKSFVSTEARIAIRERLSISDDAIVFVVVANLIPYKGHSDLFAAFGIAKQRLPRNWRLLVVGRDDGIGADLSALTKILQIEENVVFLGGRDDVPELLRSADVGILSSHQEGFSNAILEGMAEGLPMIVTNVGGNSEAVVDQETGLVVAPRNPEQFAVAIERLAGDDQLRLAMGVKAKTRVQKEFALEGCVRRYEQLYEALLKGRKPADLAEVGFR